MTPSELETIKRAIALLEAGSEWLCAVDRERLDAASILADLRDLRDYEEVPAAAGFLCEQPNPSLACSGPALVRRRDHHAMRDPAPMYFCASHDPRVKRQGDSGVQRRAEEPGMNARTTIERASTDLAWAARQLRNPDAVSALDLTQVLVAVRETLAALDALPPESLPAEEWEAENEGRIDQEDEARAAGEIP